MSTITAGCRFTSVAFQSAPPVNRCRRVSTGIRKLDSRTHRELVVKAQASADDDDFEKRLANLKKVKSPKAKKAETAAPAAPIKEKTYDFSNEAVFFEGPPSTGDLATNIVLGATLLWLPLTFAAIGRTAFVKYRVTDKRVQVTTTLPWKTESAFIAYEDVKDVVAISRGLGYWGDMVVSKKNGEKLEIRAIDKWQEIRDYIREKASATQPRDINPMDDDFTSYKASAAARKGFQ